MALLGILIVLISELYGSASYLADGIYIDYKMVCTVLIFQEPVLAQE